MNNSRASTTMKRYVLTVTQWVALREGRHICGYDGVNVCRVIFTGTYEKMLSEKAQLSSEYPGLDIDVYVTPETRHVWK